MPWLPFNPPLPPFWLSPPLIAFHAAAIRLPPPMPPMPPTSTSSFHFRFSHPSLPLRCPTFFFPSTLRVHLLSSLLHFSSTLIWFPISLLSPSPSSSQTLHPLSFHYEVTCLLLLFPVLLSPNPLFPDLQDALRGTCNAQSPPLLAPNYV